MDFEIILSPRLSPYSLVEMTTTKNWVTRNAPKYKGYKITDKRVPSQIRTKANQELKNGTGKMIVLNSIEYDMDVLKYCYKNNLVYLTTKRKKNNMYPEDKALMDAIKYNYGNGAADGWMEGYVSIIQNETIDVTLHLDLISIKPKKKK